jgi:hypothetical protein
MVSEKSVFANELIPSGALMLSPENYGGRATSSARYRMCRLRSPFIGGCIDEERSRRIAPLRAARYKAAGVRIPTGRT